ncbi:MAG: hypothetical protein JW700_01680 [Candidatus Aenigmarchaeota archaeon]|nr:hypothetical protein [Candidatus Aenigmarchaeota archaeon]
MRLWTLHPKYLDCKGLVALWRESLLARKVLEGKTVGYRHHPQLDRFRTHKNPPVAVNTYLLYVFMESQKRCYKFNNKKIKNKHTRKRIFVDEKIIFDEMDVLKTKLKVRDHKRYDILMKVKRPELNPIFLYSKKRRN